MEILQLKCLTAITAKGSFNRAALSLQMSKPAVSYHVQRLEHELGVKLVARKARGVSLTEAGRELCRHAEEIFVAVNEAIAVVEETANCVAGRVAIGTTNTLDYSFLPRVIINFHKKWPDVRFSVRQGCSEDITKALLTGQVHVAVVPQCVVDPDLEMKVTEIRGQCSPGNPPHGAVSQQIPLRPQTCETTRRSFRSPCGEATQNLLVVTPDAIALRPVVNLLIAEIQSLARLSMPQVSCVRCRGIDAESERHRSTSQRATEGFAVDRMRLSNQTSVKQRRRRRYELRATQ